jgi:hypothetical protein
MVRIRTVVFSRTFDLSSTVILKRVLYSTILTTDQVIVPSQEYLLINLSSNIAGRCKSSDSSLLWVVAVSSSNNSQSFCNDRQCPQHIVNAI